MNKKVIVVIPILIFVLSLVTELSFSQLNSNKINNNGHNGECVDFSKVNETEQEVLQEQPEPQIDPDYLRVSEITGWDLWLSTYFVTEARNRGVSVFDEALPVVAVETGNTYNFNLVNYNNNGTKDVGIFQINDSIHNYIVDKLKEEGYEFESWSRLNPEYCIAAGLYWLSYLKNGEGLTEERLFTSYNRGIGGANQLASRSGTYRSEYSEKVRAVKESFIN